MRYNLVSGLIYEDGKRITTEDAVNLLNSNLPPEKESEEQPEFCKVFYDEDLGQILVKTEINDGIPELKFTFMYNGDEFISSLKFNEGGEEAVNNCQKALHKITISEAIQFCTAVSYEFWAKQNECYSLVTPRKESFFGKEPFATKTATKTASGKVIKIAINKV